MKHNPHHKVRHHLEKMEKHHEAAEKHRVAAHKAAKHMKHEPRKSHKK